MLHATLTIASFTLLEAVRNRLAWVLGVLVLAALAIGAFIAQLALTESAAIVVALLASSLRLGAVLLIAVFVVTSIGRETDDKGQELLLALPLPRAAYLLGKLAGFALLSLAPALLFGAMAAAMAPLADSVLWALSLLCELWIVAAFALLCALSFGQVLTSMAATLAFYLLARSVSALQQLGFDGRIAERGFDAIAFVLPRLDQFARAEWLVYPGLAASHMLAVLGQTVIYVTLLGAAGMVDLYRKYI